MNNVKYNDEYIQNITSALEEITNSENAVDMESYMRNKFEFYGVQSTPRRKATRKFLKKEQRPSYKNLKPVIKKLWLLPQREFQYFAMELLLKYKKEYDKKVIDLFVYMITHKSWWDTVDMIAKKMVGEYFKLFPQKRDKFIREWLDSNNIWLQRTTLLFQLSYKEKTDVDLLFCLIKKLSHINEFFIKKAIGWSLREYSKIEPDIVKNFIATNDLSPLSTREGMKIINKN